MSDIFGPDDVSITTSSQRIAGWQSVTITRSVELFPNSFVFTATDGFPGDPTRTIIDPGDRCTICIGPDVIINGYVDAVSGTIASGRHELDIVGRGLCEDLIDCSADLLNPDSPIHGGSVTASNALDLAQKLCQSFKITARSDEQDLGRPIPAFQVALGETPYEIIEDVARYAGLLVFEDERGQLVLDRVGTQKMASGFAQGVNIESMSVSRTFQDRYSDLCVVFSTIDQFSEGAGVDPSIKRATATDPGVKQKSRYRPRIVISSQTKGGVDIAQRQANWEVARRYGRSQSLNLTVDSWRDSAGMLWQPNYLASIDIPALRLTNVAWVIATVTFRKDLSGTHADLVLMPPAAFSIEPSILSPFDPEVQAGLNQNPAPPSTSPGPGGLLGSA